MIKPQIIKAGGIWSRFLRLIGLGGYKQINVWFAVSDPWTRGWREYEREMLCCPIDYAMPTNCRCTTSPQLNPNADTNTDQHDRNG